MYQWWWWEVFYLIATFIIINGLFRLVCYPFCNFFFFAHQNPDRYITHIYTHYTVSIWMALFFFCWPWQKKIDDGHSTLLLCVCVDMMILYIDFVFCCCCCSIYMCLLDWFVVYTQCFQQTKQNTSSKSINLYCELNDNSYIMMFINNE